MVDCLPILSPTLLWEYKWWEGVRDNMGFRKEDIYFTKLFERRENASCSQGTFCLPLKFVTSWKFWRLCIVTFSEVCKHSEDGYKWFLKEKCPHYFLYCLTKLISKNIKAAVTRFP